MNETLPDAPPTRRRQLRHFLYNDVSLVRDFLAQFEDGHYDEEKVGTQSEASRGVSGSAGLSGFGLKAGAKSDQTVTTDRVIQQTPASEFNRLYERLDGEDLVTVLNGFNEPIWNQIGPGDIIEVPVLIKTPGFFQLLELAATWSALIPAISGVQGVQPIDPQVTRLMNMMATVHVAMQEQPFAVIGVAAGFPKVRFMATLKRQYLLAPPKEIEGSATMLAKVQRTLRRKDDASVLDDLGLPAKQRREFDAVVGKPAIPGFEFSESTIRGPGAVLTVIAVYR